jgi:hypothetical protein
VLPAAAPVGVEPHEMQQFVPHRNKSESDAKTRIVISSFMPDFGVPLRAEALFFLGMSFRLRIKGIKGLRGCQNCPKAVKTYR